MTTHTAALVLAAGAGTRLRTQSDTKTPKVMRECLGRPILHYVLDSLHCATVHRIRIVVGFGAERVRSYFGSTYNYVFQEQQLGSGDAVRCAASLYSDFSGALLVLCGDSPLISATTISSLIEAHNQANAKITLLTAKLDDPTGYGRLLRGQNGAITEIIEHTCTTEEQRLITEVNGGAYVFDASWLFHNIAAIRRNLASEYNLTDMVRVACSQGQVVESVHGNIAEIKGINTEQDLRDVESQMLVAGLVSLNRRLSHTDDGRRLIYYDFGSKRQNELEEEST